MQKTRGKIREVANKAVLIEMESRKKLEKLSLETLIECFEQTEGKYDQEIPFVRGWIMDELNSRNENAFEKWIMSDVISPASFFMEAR